MGLIQFRAAISKLQRLYQRQPLQYEAAENATVSADQGVQCRPIPVGVQSLLQNMIWRHAQHVYNAHQQIMLGSSWEQRQPQKHLSSHASQGPHVNTHVIPMSQQHLLPLHAVSIIHTHSLVHVDMLIVAQIGGCNTQKLSFL